MKNDDRIPTRAMALNLADWMSVSLVPFGVESYYAGNLWWRQPGASHIYLSAMNIEQHATSAELIDDLQKVMDAWSMREISLYDCWGKYDLAEADFHRAVCNPWYLRPAGELPNAGYQLPEGIVVERVDSAAALDEFERASWLGFEDEIELPEGYQSFGWHSPETLANPNMHYLVARLDGVAVAGVIAHATEDMLGIYGLSTLLPFRRQGYANALIRSAVALRPDLPTCVFPDPPSVPIYTRIGFFAAGEIAIWSRPM